MTARIAVSACLVGEPVRWDGGDRRAPAVVDLARFDLELVPFCPEVELGLGVPRPPIDLVDRDGVVALVGERGDHTAAMVALATARARVLLRDGASGYVLKSRSPSCGLRDVPVVRGGERVEAGARGLFAATIAAEIDGLPMVDERELAEPGTAASFAVRALAWSRLAGVFGFGLERRWRRGELVEHHSAEKLLLMAHSPDHYRRLGRLVAGVAGADPTAFAADYRRLLIDALASPPARGGHVNALQHIAGYFDGADRRASSEAIDTYAAGDASLDATRARLLDAARRGGHDYLARQTYLDASASPF